MSPLRRPVNDLPTPILPRKRGEGEYCAMSTALALDHVGTACATRRRSGRRGKGLGFALSPIAQQSGGDARSAGRALRHRQPLRLSATAMSSCSASSIPRCSPMAWTASWRATRECTSSRWASARRRRTWRGRDAAARHPRHLWLQRPVEPADHLRASPGCPSRMRRKRVQLIRHLTPELVWDQRWMGHRNGAEALETAILVSAERRDHRPPGAARWPAGRARPPRRLPPAPARREGRGGPGQPGDRDPIRILPPEALPRLLPGVVAPTPPFMAGMVIRTNDKAAAARACCASWNSVEAPDGIMVPPEFTGGAAVVARVTPLRRSLRTYYAPGRAALDAFHARFLGPGGSASTSARMSATGLRASGARARAVAVEPQPRLARLLRLLFHRDPGAAHVAALVGASRANSMLRNNSANDDGLLIAGLLRGKATAWEGQRRDAELRLPVTTLDALVAGHGMPDFLKIDVEGATGGGAGGAEPRAARALLRVHHHPARRRRALPGTAGGTLGYRRFNACLGEAWNSACRAAGRAGHGRLGRRAAARRQFRRCRREPRRSAAGAVIQPREPAAASGLRAAADGALGRRGAADDRLPDPRPPERPLLACAAYASAAAASAWCWPSSPACWCSMPSALRAHRGCAPSARDPGRCGDRRRRAGR